MMYVPILITLMLCGAIWILITELISSDKVDASIIIFASDDSMIEKVIAASQLCDASCVYIFIKKENASNTIKKLSKYYKINSISEDFDEGVTDD